MFTVLNEKKKRINDRSYYFFNPVIISASKIIKWLEKRNLFWSICFHVKKEALTMKIKNIIISFRHKS